MAIPISDYANPRFVRRPEGATLSRRDGARFEAQIYGGSNTRHWRGRPQPGYNALHPTIVPQKINVDIDGLALPPSAR